MMTDDRDDYRPDYDTRDREGDVCPVCDGAGIVALDSTSDDGRPCPTCTGCTDSPACARQGCDDCQRSYGPRR